MAKGSLSQHHLLELLSGWHRNSRSGAIELRNRGRETTIFVAKGSVLRAQSNQEDSQLGCLLVRNRIITLTELQIALEYQKIHRKRLGAILMEMSFIKEPVLTGTLISQTRNLVLSTVDWEEGDYVLLEFPDVENETPFEELSTPDLILTGMRRVSNIALFSRFFEHPNGILRVSPNHEDKLPLVSLNEEEKIIYSLLNSSRHSVQELAELSGMNDLSVLRSAAGLLASDLLICEKPGSRVLDGSTVEGAQAERKEKKIRPSSSETRLRKSLLGEILIREGLITQEQLRDALVIQANVKGKEKQFVGSILVELAYCSEVDIVSCLSRQLKIDQTDHISASAEVAKIIPFHVAENYSVCPIRRLGSTLEVAFLDPTNMTAVDDLSFLTSLRIQPVITTNAALKEAWAHLYGYTVEKGVQKFKKNAANTREMTLRTLALKKEREEKEEQLQLPPPAEFEKEDEEEEEEEEDHLDVQDLDSLIAGVVEDLQVVGADPEPTESALPSGIEEAPIVRLVSRILKHATTMRASDIHIEPWENKLQVRYRLDGVLHRVMTLPIAISSALISRVKVMSVMDIAEKRKPQDGRIKIKIGRKKIVDLRVSLVPSIFGESVVLRLLDRATLQLDMAKLGFDERQLNLFKRAIREPFGLILCTGPTGSGKTTTLYSAVNSMDAGANKILTVEDPVEYTFPGITQVQVHEHVGVTFPSVLRYFLRQDPDIMMVGEIRDAETAEICARAALTGHLVLSTVHTNDTASAIGRLNDIGLKPYMISAVLTMVIGQRLLRVICPHCKIEATYDKKVLLDAGLTEEEAKKFAPSRGTGCDACAHTGFSGRTAIFEMMPVTPAIKSAIAENSSYQKIRSIAQGEGMRDLRTSALEKVKAGETTLEEAIENTITEQLEQ